MKALIVDDEPLARRELHRLLAIHPSIQIVGDAGDIEEANKKIKSLIPDVVFLDIHMPGGNGFDLLAQLDWVPRIIFTTAYDHYAVKAFEVNALDYLLKPIEPDRLAEALAKLRTNSSPHQEESGDSWLHQLFVRDGPRCWLVPLREVSVLSAEGNSVRMQWGRERPLLGKSLAMLETKLDPQRFFRANRQQIINLELIRRVELGTGGRLHVQLNDGKEIQISRRQARLFRERTTI